MGRRSTGLALLGLSLALGLPATASAKAKQAVEPYKVLVVTSTSDAVSTAGISAITSAVGADGVVTAPAPADVGAQFTPANLDSYRAVVFLNTGMASPLNDAQRANFEAYYKKGGGFVGIGSAVETDATWSFLTQPARHPLVGPDRRRRPATVKVVDRVHDATKNLPEYWERTEPCYNFSTNVRGVSHVLATVVEKPFEPAARRATCSRASPAARWAPTTRSPSARTIQGGRSFYTGLRQLRRGVRRRPAEAPQGRHRLGRGSERSDLLRLRRDRAEELPAGQGHPAAEPQRADRLRSAPGRPHHPDRPSRWRAPAQPGDRHHADHRRPRRARRCRTTLRVYTNSEDGLYGPAVDQNFATNKWVYLYYAPQTVTNVRASDGTIIPSQTTPNETVPNYASDADGVGQVHRLLPALALQVRRGRQRRPPRPGLRAADPAGLQQPPGVLPRRGRHRLRQARQPVDGHG